MEYAVIIEFVIHADAEDDVLRIYSGPFKSAISSQEGFRSVILLKPLSGQNYLMVIIFVNQELQRQWVSTDLHNEVWSAMEATFSSCQVRSFQTF
ncbi:MAG: antibiotic biosynthesis monooxygenase family protein [Janthinobacterium lividum]